MLKRSSRDSSRIKNNSDLSQRRKDLFFTAGLCFLCGSFGVVVGTWLANPNVYAENRKSAVGKVGAIHELSDVSGKDQRAWLEGAKGWDQSGNYLYPVATSDSVGIGVIPTAKLDIDGQIKIRGGAPGASKVLTSDADGLASWATPSGSIPSGVIAMWSGTLASVPSGWALCDGTNGTPDLRDKFIYGWSDGVDPGGTGGATSHTHEAGTYAAPAHTHIYNEVIAHTHTIDPPSTSSSSVSAGTPSGTIGDNDKRVVNATDNQTGTLTNRPSISGSGVYNYCINAAGGGWNSWDFHRHPFTGNALPPHPHTTNIPAFASGSTGSASGTTEPGGGGAITGTSAAADHLPPYYKLAFIMKL